MKCCAWTCSALLAALLSALLLSGCKTKSYTQLEYMPDMYRGYSVRAQAYDPTAPNGIGMRLPVTGTIPRGYEFYPYALADTMHAAQLVNPLVATKDVLEAGRKVFSTWCIVCHGARGDGRGYIVPKFTQPPILYSDKVTNWPDGRLYHVATLGQGLMPSYATQILPEQRWAAIKYVRVLQRAARPTAEDLAAAQQSLLTLDTDLPDTSKTERWPKK